MDIIISLMLSSILIIFAGLVRRHVDHHFVACIYEAFRAAKIALLMISTKGLRLSTISSRREVLKIPKLNP